MVGHVIVTPVGHAQFQIPSVCDIHINALRRLTGSDDSALPDGSTVDLAAWHDRDSTFVGYAEELPSLSGSMYPTRPNVVAHLAYDVVAKALPYPVAPFYVVALPPPGDSSTAVDRIARLTVPPLTEGSHLSYAIQWFGFATVALVGAGIVIKQARSGEPRRNAPDVSPDAATGPR